jgi:hypothetical protein
MRASCDGAGACIYAGRGVIKILANKTFPGPCAPRAGLSFSRGRLGPLTVLPTLGQMTEAICPRLDTTLPQ